MDGKTKTVRPPGANMATGRWRGSGVYLILLLARGGQEADHLHGELQPLEVVLQVLSFHREAVLPGEAEGAEEVKPLLGMDWSKSKAYSSRENISLLSVGMRRINPERRYGSLFKTSCDHCCVSAVDRVCVPLPAARSVSVSPLSP